MTDKKDKILKLLESSNPLSGIEMLKTIDNQELIDSLSATIISVIFKSFYNKDCKQGDIENGNKLFEDFGLSDKILFIDFQENAYVESLNLEKFINIESIYISECEKLGAIIGLKNLKNLVELYTSNTSLIFDEEEISHIEDVTAVIHDGEWTKLFVRQNDLYWIWDEMCEWEDFFAVECLEDLEDSLGDIYLVTVPEVSEYGLSMFQLQAMWSDEKDRKHYKKQFSGFKPVKDEVIVVLYTEGWDLITDFTHTKDTMKVLCYECEEQYAFEEMTVCDKEAYCEYCVP